jgi:hypothetical protein
MNKKTKLLLGAVVGALAINRFARLEGRYTYMNPNGATWQAIVRENPKGGGLYDIVNAKTGGLYGTVSYANGVISQKGRSIKYAAGTITYGDGEKFVKAWI